MNEITFQFLVYELKISKIDFCNKSWKFNPATFSLFSVKKKRKKFKKEAVSNAYYIFQVSSLAILM